MKLSEAQFWELTPAKFFALVQRKEQKDKYVDSRFGMIVSTIINIVVGKKGKMVKPLEVMGYDDENNAPTTEQQRLQSQQEIALRFRLMTAAQKRVGGVSGI